MSPGISTRLLATQSDERLLRLVREGHERAFEALVNRYRKPLLNYCRRLSLPEARTEDVLQQALLKTWIALRDGAEVRDIKAWLYRVVHNAAVNAVRDDVHDRERVADPTLRIEGGHADIERGLVVREALAEVAALPPLQREVIVRTAVGGYSHEQVASDLGLSDGAVRGLLYRARTTLRTAATALTPPQLLVWLAGRADQGAGAPERLGELAAGGGTVGFGGLLLKGGVAAVTAGTLITGAAVVQLQGGGHRHHVHTGALAASPRSGAAPTVAGAAVAAVTTTPRGRVSAGAGATGHAGSRGAAHTRYASLGSPGSARALQGGGAGEPSRRGTVVVRHRPAATAPASAPDAASPTAAPTTSTGSVPAGSPSDQGSSKAASGEASPGGPVGSAAGAGSSGGSSSEAPPSGGGAGSEPQAPAGGEAGGSTPSGGAEESSGSSGGSSGSGSSGGEQSGGLVKTVVHEVGSVLEHLLH